MQYSSFSFTLGLKVCNHCTKLCTTLPFHEGYVPPCYFLQTSCCWSDDTRIFFLENL